MSESTGSIGGSQARTSPPQFFFVVSIVLLLTVFLGFAPTFYLPRFFDTPSDPRPMPTHLILHPVFLTAWYAGFVLQSGLIVSGRRRVHRTLGVAGVGVGFGAIVTTVVATLQAIPRASDFDFPPREFINRIVTVNTVNLLLFIALLSLAIYNRSKPQAHKRLMLIASIAIIGPAVSSSRLLGNFVQSLLPDYFPNFALMFWVLMVGALIVHDLRTLGRVHPATAWGGGAKAISTAVVLALFNSGAPAVYVDWLESLLF